MNPYSTLAIKHSQRGISLIELVVVIAIVGILASVALPSYQSFIINERRTDAHHLLLANGSRLTKCLTLAGSYDTGCSLFTTSREGYYQLTTELTATTWVLTAEPIPGEAQTNDTECQSFTLNHIGNKDATGAAGINCW